MAGPVLGDKSTCGDCRKPITFVGRFWEHDGDWRPRHIAKPMPYDMSRLVLEVLEEDEPTCRACGCRCEDARTHRCPGPALRTECREADEAPPTPFLRVDYVALRAEIREADEHDLLKLFAYEHLPPHLRAVSAQIGELARSMRATLPSGPERLEGLRKLREAKDCFVTAALAAPRERPASAALPPEPLPHPGTLDMHHASIFSFDAATEWALTRISRGYGRILLAVDAKARALTLEHLRQQGLEQTRGGPTLRHGPTGATVTVVDESQRVWLRAAEFDAAWIAPDVGLELRELVETRMRIPGNPTARVARSPSFRGAVPGPPEQDEVTVRAEVRYEHPLVVATTGEAAPSPTSGLGKKLEQLAAKQAHLNPLHYVRHDPKPEGV